MLCDEEELFNCLCYCWTSQITDPRPVTMTLHSSELKPQRPLLDVLRAGEQKQFRSAEKLFLVLFIDSRHSW